MTNNLIKNLGISILFTMTFVYALILNYSLIGIAIAVVAVGLIFLSALVYKKEQRVVEKIDIYLLVSFVYVLTLHYELLIKSFTVDLFLNNMHDFKSVQILALLSGCFLFLIFNSVSKSRKTLIARTFNKYLGLFLFALGISVFCWADLYINDVIVLLIVSALFGTIAFCRANRSAEANAMNRPTRIALFISVLSIALSVLFPSFRLTPYNLNAFLSVTVFPWYSVLILSVVLLSIVGMGLYFGKELIDEDTIFLTGLVGLIWVIKATTYFYFQFSWIAICVYTLLFLAFTNRFVKRNGSGQQTYVHFKLINNEFYWLLIAAVSTVISVYLIHIGYVYFWFSVIVGIPVVLYLHKGAPGWIRDAVFWISLLFCIATSACMFSIQNGYSSKKIVIISAIFVFSSVVMWMMNYKNTIGHNKFKYGKTTITIVFAILVIIPAVKAGAHTKIVLENESANVGSLLMDETEIVVTATADGKANDISNLKYVWTDSFFYDNDDVVNLKESSINLSVQNKHLIIWAEDKNEIITRADYWFYDAARDDTIDLEIYKINNEK